MNKFSFLLAALCVYLNAQEAKPAETKAAAPAPEVKLAGGGKAEQKAYFAEVWVGKSIPECLNFQKNIQVLSQQVEELKLLQIFLDNALTTPEKEARGHDIAAKTANADRAPFPLFTHSNPMAGSLRASGAGRRGQCRGAADCHRAARGARTPSGECRSTPLRPS